MTERRILMVLGRSAGGIAKHVAQVTEMLDGEDGLVIDIAGPVDLPVKLPKKPIEVTIPAGPVAGHRKAVARLRAIFESGGYDVVHAHGLRAGIDAGLAAREARRPVLSTVHNLVRPEIAGRVKAPLYRRAESLSVRVTARTFAVSADIALHLRKLVPAHADKIEVLHLGVGDPPVVRNSRGQVRAELGVADDVPLVVAVARLAPQKALDVLLRAAAEAATAPFVAIVGEGPQRASLEALASKLVPGRALFLGWRDDVADVIAASDAFCLSSVWEGVPLAAQESILLGVPVVATDAGGMNELVADGESGRLVPVGDHRALAVAIDGVLRRPDLARVFATTARARLDVNFSTRSMLARLKSVYLGTAVRA